MVRKLWAMASHTFHSASSSRGCLDVENTHDTASRRHAHEAGAVMFLIFRQLISSAAAEHASRAKIISIFSRACRCR